MSLIRRAAPLHDVGKIGIPDSILLKLGQAHGGRVRAGEDAHDDRRADPVGQPLPDPAARRGDRLQSPRALGRRAATPGCRANAIPLAGRIVAVADVFDALTQQRPYKEAWPVTEAIAEIERQRGRQFDPDAGRRLPAHHRAA